MSRYKHRKHRSATVIAVDHNYLPMLEVDRKHALTALATGRAVALDLRTWAKLELNEIVGRAFQVIVYPRAKLIQDVRLGFGRGNRAILRRDDFECQYEGCSNRATTVDHVVPKCQGGKSTWQNQVGCCLACNSRKGGRTPAEAGMRLKSPVRSPRFHLLEKFQALVNQVA